MPKLGADHSFGPSTRLAHPCARPRLPSRPWPGNPSTSPTPLCAWQGAP